MSTSTPNLFEPMMELLADLSKDNASGVTILWLIAVLATLVGLAVVARAYLSRRLDHDRSRLVKELGLTAARDGTLRGMVQGFEVEHSTVDSFPDAEGRTTKKARLRIGGKLPGNVAIGRDGLMAMVRGRSLASVYGPDVEVGDPEFDKRYVVKGKVLAVFALLDAESRKRFATAVDEGWTFEGGAWRFEESGTIVSGASERARQGLEWAHWLRERALRMGHTEVIERLRSDSEVGVRHRAFRAIIDRDEPWVRDLCEELRHAPDPVMRLLSAKRRKDTEVLVELALGSNLDTEIRREALGELAGHERFVFVVSELMRERIPQTSGLRWDALALLGRTASEAEENIAIEALSDPELKVRHAAVRALRDVGARRSIGALGGLRGTQDLELAAKEAIAAILLRIGSGVEGALSLAVNGGELAVAGERR